MNDKYQCVRVFKLYNPSTSLVTNQERGHLPDLVPTAPSTPILIKYGFNSLYLIIPSFLGYNTNRLKKGRILNL